MHLSQISLNFIYRMKIIFISILLLSSLSFTQTEPDPFSFFPSAVGNYWEYSDETRHIVKDSTAEDGSRFIFYQNPPSRFGADFKVDSAANVFYLPEWNEYRLEYKLTADSGDTWMVEDYNFDGGGNRIQALVEDTYYISIFDTMTLAKRIEYYILFNGDTTITESSWQIKTDVLASGFGLVWYAAGAEQPTSLYGCIINGKRYGTLVSVEDEEEIINEFNLNQNYPNPFNPTTKISFDLPSPLQGEGPGVRSVKLAVYDILGRKVKTLLNEEIPPGKYSVTFDASGLPSGIYIYKLTAGNFSASKKMLLLK